MTGQPENRRRRGGFATTRWSLVLAAGDRDAPDAAEALAELCRAYWYPLYAYVRRWGRNPQDAQDLTQEFLTRVIERQYLRQADPGRGRFRSFLLASLKHFLSNERERERALKRGGGVAVLPFEIETAEGRYQCEPADEETPDRLFERRWALELLVRVLDRLRAEQEQAGRLGFFETVRDLLTEGRADQPYAGLAASLGMSEGALRVAVHRLRRRYGELLRQAIGETVADPAEVDEEIRYLFAALR
jgi:RNA polymerase sigma-70 factor (ECF subfamily)